jgi:hypothetical protein
MEHRPPEGLPRRRGIGVERDGATRRFPSCFSEPDRKKRFARPCDRRGILRMKLGKPAKLLQGRAGVLRDRRR